MQRSSRSKYTLPFGPHQTENRLTQIELQLKYSFEYSVNFRDRVILITDDIKPPLFDFVDAAMTEMEALNGRAITLRINSGGGSVTEAQAIVGRMERSKCKIFTEGYGSIMSSATLILAAGDKRKVSRLSQFMWHESSYDPGYDRTSSHEEQVKQAKEENKAWSRWMEEFTSKPASFWLKKGVKSDAYFTPDQLLEYGVVDEIF